MIYQGNILAESGILKLIVFTQLHILFCDIGTYRWLNTTFAYMELPLLILYEQFPVQSKPRF